MKDREKYKGYNDIYDCDYKWVDDDDCGFENDNNDDDANADGEYHWDSREHIMIP